MDWTGLLTRSEEALGRPVLAAKPSALSVIFCQLRTKGTERVKGPERIKTLKMEGGWDWLRQRLEPVADLCFVSFFFFLGS